MSSSPVRSYNWWLRLTSSAPQQSIFDIAGRERERRSRLTSWLILGLFGTDALVIPLAIGSMPTVIAIISVFIGLLFAVLFNRQGWVTAAGALLIVLVTFAVMGSIATEPTGLGMFDLPGYDLLVLTVIVGASILAPVSAFFIAGINCGLILLDFTLQPHAPDLTASIQLNGTAGLLARPLAIQLIVAVVGYLWVHGTNEQIRRAEHAEQVAALEHAFAEQRRQLEVGVQQILATHVRIANGDYTARAPLTQDNVLWQIAASLNNLVVRLRTSSEQAGQAGYQLQRTTDEVQRVASALRDLQAGRRPVWPRPTGTVADELIQILASGSGGGGGNRRPSVPPSRPSSWEGPPQLDPQRYGGFPPLSQEVHSAPTGEPPIPSWFFQSQAGSDQPPNMNQAGRMGSDPAPRGPMPAGMGQQRPSYPSGGFPGFPGSSGALDEGGWPSLDPLDRPSETNGERRVDNPWYLPPEE